MAKDSYWFKHDNNARNDEKILELRAKFGPEGYGIYWMIVETMAEDEHGYVSFKNMGGLSLGYGVAIGRLSEVIGGAIEVGLFHEKEGKVFSNRMLKHKEDRKNLSDSGKNGAKKRWGGYREGNGVAIADPIAEKKREEERRKEGEERRGETGEIIFNIEEYLFSHQSQFELIAMDAMKTGISEQETKEILNKYHLWNQENDKYPKKPLQLIAGLKKWLLNEKKFSKPTIASKNATAQIDAMHTADAKKILGIQ